MSYDSIHNITQKTQAHVIVQPSGTSVTQKKTSYDFAYQYNASGLNSIRPHAPNHIGERAYTYDANGNQTGWTHDRNGTRRTIVWDEENRIQSLFDNGHEKTYKYDDQGNRAIKRGPQGETVYVNQFFTSRPGATGTKHIYAGTTRIASKLLRQDVPNSNPAGKTPFEKDLYFYHPDHLGTSNYITDLNAKLYEHLEYFPFGEAWVEENSNSQRTPYLFTAKELDEETGLYYFGARYYDPRTSVWQSADPVLTMYLPMGNRERDQNLPAMGGVYMSLNLALYSYAHHHPVVFSDKDGRWASQKGFYVHQRATYLNIGRHLTMRDVRILADAHVFADREEFQTPAMAFRHAMRSPEQSVLQARDAADTFVRNQFERAFKLRAEGRNDEALLEFTVALHTLQDATSPAHHGFQEWSGEETLTQEIGHVSQEIFNPGEGSELYRVTTDAWSWYQSGKLPEGNLFDEYGSDAPREVFDPNLSP